MKNPARIYAALLLALAVSGCGDAARLSRQAEELAAMSNRVVELEYKLDIQKQEFREAQRRKLDEWQQQAEERITAVAAERDERERELKLRLAVLEKENDQLRRKLDRRKKAATPDNEPTEPSVPVQVVPDVTVVSVSDEQTFPLEVFMVRGETVVVGVHTNVSYEKTEEVVDDRYGNPQPVMAPVFNEEKQYNYEAVFDVKNLSDQPRTFTARAGALAVQMDLAPGRTETFRITASKGADLLIKCAGMDRSFPVKF